MKTKSKNKLNKLEKIRLNNNLTYQEMALKLNLSKAYYWQIENGNRNLYYKVAVKIAKVFSLKPDDLFYDDLK